MDETARRAVLASGGGPQRIFMNCSGKHAAMLSTCATRGWPLAGYLSPDHPLQLELARTVAELAGQSIDAVGVDGCGAPIYALSLTGLAGAFLRLADAVDGPEHTVAAAMRAYPELVAGTGRTATRLMAGLPGLVAKDGAEGVWAAALPGVGAVAAKIEDGAMRAADRVVVAALSGRLGGDARPGPGGLGASAAVLDELATEALFGGGHQVGEVRMIAGAG
jgi:L-asparaginase II